MSKTLSLIQPVSPILAVANAGNSTVAIYTLSTIANSSGPVITLETGSKTGPFALTFDTQGDLWIGSGRCDSGTLEEFAPPFTANESPELTVSGLHLAFDASGNLWVATYCSFTSASFSSSIEEFNPATLKNGSTSPTPTISLNLPGAVPSGGTYVSGLALDSSGNLWASGFELQNASNMDVTTPELLEYISAAGIPKTFPAYSVYLVPSLLGSSPAFSVSGTLYAVLASPLDLCTPPSCPLKTLTQVGGYSLSTPLSLAFDASGDLWIADPRGVQELTTSQLESSSFTPSTVLTNGQGAISDPDALAIWPIPQGLPLY
jgi:hypothetical protein